MARYYIVLLICFAVYPTTTNGHAEESPEEKATRRRKRSIFTVGKQLFTAKLATEAVLKDAKEIRLDTVPFVNYVDNAGGSFKKYEKSGGYKQAYKDFKRFPADERQNFLMPYGGDGKWAIAGDRIVILERRKDRDWSSLIIKYGAGTPNEHIDKIIYKEQDGVLTF